MLSAKKEMPVSYTLQRFIPHEQRKYIEEERYTAAALSSAVEIGLGAYANYLLKLHRPDLPYLARVLIVHTPGTMPNAFERLLSSLAQPIVERIADTTLRDRFDIIDQHAEEFARSVHAWLMKQPKR